MCASICIHYTVHDHLHIRRPSKNVAGMKLNVSFTNQTQFLAFVKQTLDDEPPKFQSARSPLALILEVQ